MSMAFESWRDQGVTFAFRGYRIFYRCARAAESGPCLLLIHGLPTASWDYHHVWPALSARSSLLLAPDMLGFGWSEKPAAHQYSIFEQADLHEALLRLHGVTHVRIVAHDYGVTVAQELLARHGERMARGDHSLTLESICFLNGGLFPEAHRPFLIQRLMPTALGPLLARGMSFGAFRHNFRRIFGPHTQPSAAEMNEFWQLLIAGDGRRMFHRLFQYMPERRVHRERWVSALQHSKVPLRLIDGPEDPISGVHLVTRYRELVPNADVTLLPGIGHYPHVEDPAGVLRALSIH